jgi:methionyl-tRNA formyltransferase
VRAVVFAYHEIGYVCLEEVVDFGVEVQCLFTHEDDPGEEIWFRRPAALAEAKGIPVYTPKRIKDSAWIEKVRALAPDIVFSFYYRNIIPRDILDVPRIGAFNLHGSLLPKFRGRCPVNWVLIEGEDRTGVTLHVMEEKADTGDIVAQRAIDIAFHDTARSLFLKMVREAQLLMRDVLPQFRSGTFMRTPQSGPFSYFGGRRPEDGLISWEKDAQSIYNLARATTHPYPGAFSYLDGKKLHLWETLPEERILPDPPGTVVCEKPLAVNTGRGVLQLLHVQLEGEREMSGEAFAATHDVKNRRLGGRP